MWRVVLYRLPLVFFFLSFFLSFFIAWFKLTWGFSSTRSPCYSYLSNASLSQGILSFWSSWFLLLLLLLLLLSFTFLYLDCIRSIKHEKKKTPTIFWSNILFDSASGRSFVGRSKAFEGAGRALLGERSFSGATKINIQSTRNFFSFLSTKLSSSSPSASSLYVPFLALGALHFPNASQSYLKVLKCEPSTSKPPAPVKFAGFKPFASLSLLLQEQESFLIFSFFLSLFLSFFLSFSKKKKKLALKPQKLTNKEILQCVWETIEPDLLLLILVFSTSTSNHEGQHLKATILE